MMLLLLNQVICISHHRRFETSLPTLSSNFDLQNYPGKYCSISGIFDYLANDKISLKTRGINPQLQVKGFPAQAKYYCISMSNVSNSDQVLWLYINVDADPNSKGTSLFAQNLMFKDFGQSLKPIQSNYQKSQEIEAGYFGPINRYSFANSLLIKPSQYKITVYMLKDKISTTNEADSIIKCKQSKVQASVIFKSKFAIYILTTFLLTFIY